MLGLLLSLTGVPMMFVFRSLGNNSLVPVAFETSTADGGISVSVRHKQGAFVQATVLTFKLGWGVMGLPKRLS